MTSLQLPPALRKWLKQRNLRVDERAMRRHLESRNPTLHCRDARGRRVFVKAAVRDDPGVAHERVVLSALQSLPNVPRVLHSTKGMLALEWLEGRTLWEHRRARKRGLDAEIGAALARVQLLGRGAVSRFGVRGDLGKRLLWTAPGLYASFSPASLELFRQVQQSGATRGLMHLLEREAMEPKSLVHGDLRQPNVMITLRPRTAHPERSVTFIDWELCGLGDPTRDLGMLLAEDVRVWLLPRGGEAVLSRERLTRHCSALIRGWETTAETLGFGTTPDHRARVIGWAAEALLRAAYTMSHHEAYLPRPLVDAAIAMLEAPDDWAAELLGASS